MESGKQRLLLHTCCAPCSTSVIERLRSDFHLSAFFFNPNIHPREEYELRARQMREYARKAGMEFIEPKYDTERWFASTRGMETEPEGGKRCLVCYRLRLESTAEYAARSSYDYFTTTLSLSPHKNAQNINQIGREISQEYRIKYLEADFKKKDGFKRSLELSKTHDLIRQDYCGCIYSKQGKEKEA
ncbi:MAG: epoxyqueuosine reductase QueH [Deltaproteobacteria bacterium]|nr:MAG: epoxyqueuosine reductase QueH [Deltaproteobacteria bacterium]